MTDQELLEKAAKAAGITGEWFESEDGPYLVVGNAIWDPLQSDGDAFRLAVTLGLCVERSTYAVRVSRMPTEAQSDEDERGDILSAESLGVGCLCPFKDTRRAIVRAAAECVV